MDYSQNANFRSQHIDPWVRTYGKAFRDKSSIEDAKELIPIAELIQDNLDILEDDRTYKDKLLPLVVDWFANDFFEWFKEPPCEKCSGSLRLSQVSRNEEGNNFERYRCTTGGCDHHFDFIRHNDPAILLRTRTGRCGEWANCFLTILLALDYDARVVNDTTDHVWNEVWSEAEGRWIHVDSCERVVDRPLLYEVGWKKKLEYCLAFGKYEVSDVTARYSVDYSLTKSRRTQCQESWLKHYLDQVTSDSIKLAQPGMKILVLLRRAKDLEYLQATSQKPQEILDRCKLGGRTTGSLKWRMDRGECSTLVQSGTIVKVRPKGETSNDVSKTSNQSMFELSYNCDKDTYGSTVDEYQRKGWSTIIYQAENIAFKYERDWRTSYLARYESCPHDQVGQIIWRFDLSEMESKDLQRIEVTVRGQEYPNTSARTSLKCYSTPDFSSLIDVISLELNKATTLTFGENLKPEAKYLELIVDLSGGSEEDPVAWQKPQLFRQVRNKDVNESMFSFRVFQK